MICGSVQKKTCIVFFQPQCNFSPHSCSPSYH